MVCCSTGERQRLALLSVLLLDEPTGKLDADSCGRVEALIADDRARHGAAVLWVSHDAGQVARVAERGFRLVDGQLSAAAAPMPA